MAAEEDMFVVIIGDEGEQQCPDQVPAPIQFKQEVHELSDDCEMQVEYLLETAEKHGRHIKLEDIVLNNIKSEPVDFQYLDEDVLESDEFILPDDSNDNDHDDRVMQFKPVQIISTRRRVKMLDPSQRRSFVEALRKQNPYFKENKDALIEHLYNVMVNVKPPKPTCDFYRVHDLQYECIECEALFDKVMSVTRHYQDKHGPRYLFCYACGVDFRSITNLYKHEKRCRAPDHSVVLKARARMVGLKGRARPFLLPREQLVKIQKPKKFPCTECTAVYMSRTGLTAHSLLHRGQRPYVCAVCQAAYTSRSALSRHWHMHTDIKFQCDLCGREFKIKSALASHMDVHLPVKKFACPLESCSRRFATRTALSAHVRARHDLLPPPCACRLCPKRFPRNSLLKVHMRKAHGMILMTRKMFFKTLPTLTDTQVKQARVFFKHDQPRSPQQDLLEQLDYIDNNDKQVYKNEENNDKHVHKSNGVDRNEENNDKHVHENNDLNEESQKEESDLFAYVKSILAEKAAECDRGNTKIVVVENGEFNIVEEGSELREKYEKLVAEITGGKDDGENVADSKEHATDGIEDFTDSNEHLVDVKEYVKDGNEFSTDCNERVTDG